MLKSATASLPRRSARLIASAVLVALFVAILLPSIAAAAPARAFELSGDSLTARVVGGETTGAWRVRIVAPGQTERIDIVLRSGDLTWSAVVRTSERNATGWQVVDREHIGGTFRGLRRESGEGAGVRWDSADFRLPSDGDGRFAVSVQLLRDGEYRVVGSVRNSADAFLYGPWQRVSASHVEH